MTDYWVNDDGDNSDGSTLAKAYTSIANLVSGVAAALTTSGNNIFIVYDHNDTGTGANRTFTFPSSGAPVNLISVDNNATPTYRVGTGNQLYSLDGAYSITIDGAFSLFGIRIASGAGISLGADANEASYADSAKFVLAANATLTIVGGGPRLLNCVTDLSADASTGRSAVVISAAGGNCQIQGMTFVGPEYRTGVIFSTTGSSLDVSGCDFSGFTNATTCEVFAAAPSGISVVSNCLTASGTLPLPLVASLAGGGTVGYRQFYNVGAADSPSLILHDNYIGGIVSSTLIYRTGGATVESVATSWLVNTIAACTETSPMFTPWIYGTLSSTGSKTWSIYVVNDTADFTNAEVWLEVEYLGTADNPKTTVASGQRANITTAAATNSAPNADDTTSTWNGTGPSFTYKQKFAVTATVNEEGQYRARLVIGKASILSSRNFYIDPKVTVS